MYEIFQKLLCTFFMQEGFYLQNYSDGHILSL